MTSKNDPSTIDFLELLKRERDYDEVLEKIPGFVSTNLVDHLDKLIDEKKQKKSTVIDRSGVEKSYAYQIFKGTRKPSRDRLIALMRGMELSYEEAQRLLKISGFPQLYAKNKRDNLIIFAFKKNYPVYELNEKLEDHGEELLT